MKEHILIHDGFKPPYLYHDLDKHRNVTCGAQPIGDNWYVAPRNPASDELCVCARCLRARVNAASHLLYCVSCDAPGLTRFCDACATQHPDRFTAYLDSIYPAKEAR